MDPSSPAPLSQIGRSLDQVPTPAFVVDLDVVKANCDQMWARAQDAGIQVRGQTKTHKTVEGAILQTKGSKRGLVTSTLVETEMLAQAGFDDILYGYPILQTHMERNMVLAQKITTYHLMRLESHGIQVETVGIGSTPSCSHTGPSLGGLTEIHPGNYVFYDAQQMKLGSCQANQVAGKVLTRVIGHSLRRNQLIVDCGFLGLTKQGFEDLGRSFALIEGHPNLKLCDMTQEIGKVESQGDDPNINFRLFPIGSLLTLIPYHSCATAAMYPVYYVHQSGTVKEEWKPCRGW
eukprot:maker-scaffold92_size382268-snap-gene-1.18 protein:Tk08747 transcript:maker-scaffold92_size382268-snap-gene-1.18-mRNA-1 annotation:"d-serine dehydratase-like"